MSNPKTNAEKVAEKIYNELVRGGVDVCVYYPDENSPDAKTAIVEILTKEYGEGK